MRQYIVAFLIGCVVAAAVTFIVVMPADACSVLCATCKPCEVPKRDPQWRDMCDGEETACGRQLKIRRGLVYLHPSGNREPDLVTAPCNCKFERRERVR